MAGKKNSSSFSANPFKTLKGFAVAEQKEQAIPPAQGAATSEEKVELDFAAEMHRFGVSRIESQEELRPLPPEPTALPSPVAGGELSDDELFLVSLGPMQTVFSDHYPGEMVHPSVESRRMKQVRQGRLQPEAMLDLHGLTRVDAVSRVRWFLDDASARKLTMVLLITGWGRSGSGEAVLRETVIALLEGEGRSRVSEWALAPRHLGGEGALIVFLRHCPKG